MKIAGVITGVVRGYISKQSANTTPKAHLSYAFVKIIRTVPHLILMVVVPGFCGLYSPFGYMELKSELNTVSRNMEPASQHDVGKRIQHFKAEVYLREHLVSDITNAPFCPDKKNLTIKKIWRVL